MIRTWKYWWCYCQERTKKLIHRLGQILFNPVWNYLPGTDFPESLQLAIILTTRCNANCIFCAYQFLPNSERTDMPEEVFSKLVENIKQGGISQVHFTSHSGEPLLAPNFLEKIMRIREAGVRTIRLTTNAILLDKIGIAEFFKSGPDRIIISTAPFNADMYRRIYRSAEFERMRANVLNLLIQNKKQLFPRNITISINPDVPKKEVLAMPETQRLISLADKVWITEAYGDWLGLIKNSMLHGVMRIEKAKPLSRRPCRILLTCPAIHPNGDITACACRNIYNDPEMYLGNILQSDLNTVLKKIENIAVRWRKGKIPKICYLCTMYGDSAYHWPEYIRNFVSKALLNSAIPK